MSSVVPNEQGRDDIAATDALGEFALYSWGRDEWFEVCGQDGSRRRGERIFVDRGDKIRISFQSVQVGCEYEYLYRAEAEITQVGELVILRNCGEIFGVFPPAADLIMLLPPGGGTNAIRFDRVEVPMVSDPQFDWIPIANGEEPDEVLIE